MVSTYLLFIIPHNNILNTHTAKKIFQTGIINPLSIQS